jgi:hypothetical protein
MPQDADKPLLAACATANCLTHFIILIAALENVPPDAGLQKRATFSNLNLGLAGTHSKIWRTTLLPETFSSEMARRERSSYFFLILTYFFISLFTPKSDNVNNYLFDKKS